MSDNLELSVDITTEEPEVAATLSDLRYLVFRGMAGIAPRVGTSGKWEVFDNSTQAWVDTGVYAHGQDAYSPYIGDNGYWYAWDDQGQEYVNTNVKAQGPQGNPGEDGEDGVSPTVAVANIAGGHRVTITDAEHPQGQSFAVMNGSGIPEDVKVALLDCFENVAWINDDGQTYYDALYAALYPPKTLVSISAAFNQGSAVIYDTDSLDTLKQYLTVTATYDDSSTGVVTNYTLSGTLTEGTSTITVLYSGKTTTFDVAVTEGQGLPSAYQAVEYIEGTGTQFINTELVPTDVFGFKIAFSSRDVRTDTTYFGTKVGANMACYGGFYNGKPYLGWNSVVTDNGLITSVTAGNPTEVSLNYKNSREVKQGNTSILQSNKSPLATLTGDYSSVPFRLFGRSNSEAPTVKAAMVFSAEFTNGSDVVANMIPCYNKTSGVIGMYDIVRKRFFTNDGTGTFLKGGDVA